MCATQTDKNSAFVERLGLIYIPRGEKRRSSSVTSALHKLACKHRASHEDGRLFRNDSRDSSAAFGFHGSMTLTRGNTNKSFLPGSRVEAAGNPLATIKATFSYRHHSSFRDFQCSISHFGTENVLNGR